jgi:hypothetical protein
MVTDSRNPISTLGAAALLAVGVSLAAPGRATGQVVDREGVPYRQWDVSGSAGVHIDREPTAGHVDWLGEDRDWRGGFLVQGDLGRYWNSHMKTELSFGFISPHVGYASEPVVLPEGTAFASIRTRSRRQQVAAAFTYQFFDNVFAHPYVSVGVRATLHDSESIRQPRAWISTRTSTIEVAVPPRETREVDVLVRPILAAGFKSYFNERTFIRSELSTAYARGGLSQWALRLGYGVDF